MEPLVERIRERHQAVLAAIARSAAQVGRDPSGVRLVVVSKSQPVQVVQAAVQAGVRLFGENYPEQALEKIAAFAAQNGVEWHMIGHLQRRKAGLVVKHFNLLHSLDSLALARRLDRLAGEAGRRLKVLLEFNLADEPGKSGWPAGEQATWEGLLPELAQVLELQNLEVCGLMAMPPLAAQPEQSRPYFQRLRNLRDLLQERFPGSSWQELSIGTSADYQVAVQEGATLVRVGQAILGPRPMETES